MAKKIIHPTYILKESVKDAIKVSSTLQGIIRDKFDISHSTLMRWLDTDDPAITSFTTLVIIWDFLTEMEEPEIKSIQDLLTTK